MHLPIDAHINVVTRHADAVLDDVHLHVMLAVERSALVSLMAFLILHNLAPDRLGPADQDA